MSEKKLFKVDLEVSFEMVVEAESVEEATRWAEEHYKDGLDDVGYPSVFGSVMGSKPLDKCPPDWKGCCPYNSDDKRTVDQRLGEGADGPQEG